MKKIQTVLISMLVSVAVSLLVSQAAAEQYFKIIDRYVDDIFGELKETAKLIDKTARRSQ